MIQSTVEDRHVIRAEDMVLAIDPGKHKSGWALFWASGTLRAAGFDAPTTGLKTLGCTLFFEVSLLVVERPVVRRVGRSKGNPNDLVDVAFAAGRWSGLFPSAKVFQVKPEDWKGQLDKPICHARARATLSAEELARIPDLPKTRGLLDMWDAVSLGLVHLGRLRMR